MEPRPTPKGCRVLFGALVIVWVCVHVLGFIVGGEDGSEHARIPLGYRMAGSATLVLCGWLWLWAAGATLRRFGLLIALGMTFGCLGDMAMAQLLPGPDSVITGMGLFALCHVFYMWAYLHAGGLLGLNRGSVRGACIAGWLAVAFIVWALLVNSPDQEAVRVYGALGYCLIIALMTGLATALAVQSRYFTPLMAGAALFLASDVLLAGSIFHGLSWPLLGDHIWVLYIVGQALIVLSPAYARRHLGRVQRLAEAQAASAP